MAEETTQNPQTTIHVTQDERGLWMLSVEHPDGTMQTLAHSGHDLDAMTHEAQEIIGAGRYGNVVLRVDEPRGAPTPPASGVPTPNRAPAPRRVGEVLSTSDTPPKFVYWVSDVGGNSGGVQSAVLFEWLYEQISGDQPPALIIHGGDVYWGGTYLPGSYTCTEMPDLNTDFGKLFYQLGYDKSINDYDPIHPDQIDLNSVTIDCEKANALLALMCETAGNHDWGVPDNRVPACAGYPAPTPPLSLDNPQFYEQFWNSFPYSMNPKLSKSQQPIDKSKVGGARYEHFQDINGWRLIFLDTGNVDADPKGQGTGGHGTNPWPMGDPSRVAWLDEALNNPTGVSGASMVFSHYSRLSCGQVGDNPSVDKIWKQLFDASGIPRAVCTMAGHDHNVSVYVPRDQNLEPVPIDGDNPGIQIIVNGAGGGAGLFTYMQGTRPDAYPVAPFPGDYSPLYCITQFILQADASGNPTQATVNILSFDIDGDNPPTYHRPNNPHENPPPPTPPSPPYMIPIPKQIFTTTYTVGAGRSAAREREG